MDIAQKALYNSLRMSFLQDTEIFVEPWKIEDYRMLSFEELFLRLHKREIFVDKSTFISYANEFDTPEELAEWLAESEVATEDFDQIYLLIFELWRRLIPEKPSVSILCDELDYQIYNFD